MPIPAEPWWARTRRRRRRRRTRLRDRSPDRDRERRGRVLRGILHRLDAAEVDGDLDRLREPTDTDLERDRYRRRFACTESRPESVGQIGGYPPRHVAQGVERLLRIGPQFVDDGDRPLGSRHQGSASPAFTPIATSCWAPSWRFRSMRRSASAARPGRGAPAPELNRSRRRAIKRSTQRDREEDELGRPWNRGHGSESVPAQATSAEPAAGDDRRRERSDVNVET